MNAPVFDRRRSERFAELASEIPGQPRHRRRTELDAEVGALVGLTRRIGELEVSPAPDPEFQSGLRAMLMAKIERDGIGVTVEAKAAQAAARAALAGKTQIVRRVDGAEAAAGRPGRTRAALLIGVTAALALSGVSAASTDSLPGEALYQVKRSSELAQLALAGSDESRGRLHLDFAQGRLSEAHRIHPTHLADVLAQMDAETRSGVSLLTAAAVHRADAGVLDIILSFVDIQRERLAELPRPAGTPGSDDPVLRSMQLLDKAEARILALKAVLGQQQCTSGAIDELGPVPRDC